MTRAQTIDVRDAAPEDADAIARTHIACWQEAYAGQLPDDLLGRLPDSFDRRREMWHEVAQRGGERNALLVADVNGEVVGFVHVRSSRDEQADLSEGEVTAIYLRKQWWGQGIGRRLFQEGVDRLRGLGFRSAILWTLETNERTRRFYEAATWEFDGGEKVDELGDVTLNEVRYRTVL